MVSLKASLSIYLNTLSVKNIMCCTSNLYLHVHQKWQAESENKVLNYKYMHVPSLHILHNQANEFLNYQQQMISVTQKENGCPAFPSR